ncbi:MAG: type II toxin-antitoxin system Phd/YefM family antitoxin [Lysobacterales bacterium]
MTDQNLSTGEEEITVRDANQGFSRLIARVERGVRFVVTKKGKPVAHIAPVDATDGAREQRRRVAMKRVRALMQSGAQSDEGWTYAGDRGSLHGSDV